MRTRRRARWYLLVEGISVVGTMTSIGAVSTLATNYWPRVLVVGGVIAALFYGLWLTLFWRRWLLKSYVPLFEQALDVLEALPHTLDSHAWGDVNHVQINRANRVIAHLIDAFRRLGYGIPPEYGDLIPRHRWLNPEGTVVPNRLMWYGIVQEVLPLAQAWDIRAFDSYLKPLMASQEILEAAFEDRFPPETW